MSYETDLMYVRGQLNKTRPIRRGWMEVTAITGVSNRMLRRITRPHEVKEPSPKTIRVLVNYFHGR